MSWRLVQGAQELTIPRAQKSVLVVLAHIAADDGTHCWAGMDLIGARAGIHPRNARKHIRALEAAGWLRLIAGGGRRTNEYQLDAARLIAAMDAATLARRSRRRPDASSGATALPDRAVAPAQPGRTRPLSPGATAPQAVIETSTELEVEPGNVVSILPALTAAAPARPKYCLVHGVSCWVDAWSDDRTTVAALVSAHGAPAVEAAAARLHARGSNPRPSAVAAELLSAAATRAADQRRQAVTSPTPAVEDAATAAALAEAQMAAYRRAGGAA